MIENQHIRIWKEERIMFGEYKVEEVTPDIAQHMIATRLEGCNDESFPFLADVRKVKTITKEARSAFAEGDGIKLMPACALLVDSPVNRLLGNFFLSVSKPKVPTKLFTSKEEAMTWLNGFVNEKVSL